MPHADETASVLRAAAQRAMDGSGIFAGTDADLTEALSELNSAKKAIETAQRKLLTGIKAVRDAKTGANIAFGENASYGAETYAWLNKADETTVEEIQLLQKLRLGLETTISHIRTVARDNSQNQFRMSDSAERLNTLADIL